MMSSASLIRAARSAYFGKEYPRGPSFRFSPVPTPRVNLPPLSLSSVAAAWATTAGWNLHKGVVTPVVNVMVDVAWAMAAIVA